MKSSKNFLLSLLVIIASSAKVTEGQDLVSTKPFVTAYWGGSVELPCQISRQPYAVYWYRHNSTDAPDNDASIVVQNFNGKDIAKAGPRFEITSNFSMKIHNVTVQDETKYSCRVAWLDDQMTSYTQVRVVALADDLNPIAVENCLKNGTDRCVYYIAPSESTIQLKCKVVGVQPAVNLTWTDALTGEVLPAGKTDERVDKKTGLVTVSRVTPITGLDIGQDRICQAKGEAVRGTSLLNVFLRKEPQEPSSPGRSSTPAVVGTLVPLFLVGLTVAAVIGWFLWRKRQRKKSEGDNETEATPLKSAKKSEIDKKRKRITDYRPGRVSKRHKSGDVQLPSQVKISVIGPTGAGKSSFIRSLDYALTGDFSDTIEVAGEMTAGGVTLENTAYDLTKYIIVEDNRGLKDLDGKLIDDLLKFFRGRGVHCLILVYNSVQPIDSLNEFLSELTSRNRREFGSHPVLVLTHRHDAEEKGKKDSIIDEAKAVGALDQKLSFVENFTERLDEDDPELEERTVKFLDVFLKLLAFADDNLVRQASGVVSSPAANEQTGNGTQQQPGGLRGMFRQFLSKSN